MCGCSSIEEYLLAKQKVVSATLISRLMNEEEIDNIPLVPVTSEDAFDIKGRPNCDACGDPVKIVFHDGIPSYALHCKECFAELRYGKIPKLKGKRYL